MVKNVNTVYLSKSNHSNPDQVMKVREWLDKKGFTIIEHTGGVYDESLLRKAQIMVMVGCNKIEYGFTAVGKGQYMQLKHRVSHGLMYNYYAAGYIYGNIVLRKAMVGKLLDTDNWTHKYGSLKIKMETTIRISTSQEPVPDVNPDSQIDGGQDMMKQADRTVVVQGEPARYTEGVGNDGEVFVKNGVHVNDVDITDPRSRWKHLACITLFK